MSTENKILHLQGKGPYYTNSFMILSSKGWSYVIDPACKAEQYQKAAEENQCKIRAILVTHGHFDHVYGLNELKAASGAPVYLSRIDCIGDKIYPIGTSDQDLQDGEILFSDDISLHCFSTPGHSEGSFVFLYDKYLFSGDTLFSGSIGRTDLEGGSYSAIMNSLKKILDLNLEPDTVILPGHGEFSVMQRELHYNDYLLECQENE